MIQNTRAVFAALTILLASATALIATPDLAAAHGSGHDHKDRKVHKDHGDDRHSDHARSHHRRKHDKHKVVCIKAPCPGDSGEEHGKRRRKQADDDSKGKAATSAAKGHDKGCGTIIVPTAGCATPARDPVGNTHPSLPQRTDTKRKPVLENVRRSQPLSANESGKPAAVAGKSQNDDSLGSTHPATGSNPPAAVTVSNGLTTRQIQNGLGGVTVYSDKPGTITVTNGKDKTTLSGASVTLSGNVVGVGGGQGVQVGQRNGEGKTVVAIKRAPEFQNNDSRDVNKCFGCGVLGGVHDFAYGVAHGFAPGPAPSPKTSTTTQQ